MFCVFLVFYCIKTQNSIKFVNLLNDSAFTGRFEEKIALGVPLKHAA